MRTSKMTRTITFCDEIDNPVAGDYGKVLRPLFSTRAEMFDKTTRQAHDGNQLSVAVNTQFTYLRPRQFSVKTDMYVKCQGRVYRILTPATQVDKFGRFERIECVVKEGVYNG